MTGIFNITVIVAALGYFVDVYDLILFSVVRVQSLKDLGFSGEELTTQGIYLINMQMAGMLLGGILWGVLGDKRGRLSVLFGSIILYSVANAANGMVTTIEGYALFRLLAGIGLAGELGAGVTLVSEILPKGVRGYGTAMVASVGVLGALLAGVVAKTFDWRVAYYIGGGLGLMLLILRMQVFESKMFQQAKAKAISRGNFLMLMLPGQVERYLQCILIGVPIWFVIVLPITLSPEFAQALGVVEPINAGNALMFCYFGLSLGDMASGLLSQRLKSRKKTVAIFLGLMTASLLVFLNLKGMSAEMFYTLCTLLGFSAGYWAMFVTIGAEQFGTNLRATVATTVPNFVRGSVIGVTSVFTLLRPQLGILSTTLVLGGILLVVAFGALYFLEETFHKDMDYLEPLS